MPEEPNQRRPFATGSKPGPDAVDHYLEEQGYYRKHVARDASSLFRVVSEQVLDIQNYYENLRQDCASFMEQHVKEYSNEIDKNFYNYISNLRRARTYGSLLELRVLARMYKKNVILFEPTQNQQTSERIYVQNDEYDSKKPLRVFYSHKDKHFDTIFTIEEVERLAETQSIVYECLYSNVFQLPDVVYAVERMLHDQDEKTTLPLPDDPAKYQTAAGDIMEFDKPENTHCVLKDPKTCHFHNQVDFEEVVQNNKDAITVINRADEPGRLKIYKPIDGFLHDDLKSCVRQLLDEKITPFPYKVAKALDPSIYRNTEFELWSENRKEQRLKWLDSAEMSLKAVTDDKNWMYLDEYKQKGHRSYEKFNDFKIVPELLNESQYLALDDDAKKKYVILDPVEPYKLHNLASLEHFQPKGPFETIVMPANVNHQRGGFKNKRGGGRQWHNNNNNQQHHHPTPQQMNYVGDIEREATYQYQEQPEYNYQPLEQHSSYVYEQHPQMQAPQQGQVYQHFPQQQWNPQTTIYHPQPYAAPVAPSVSIQQPIYGNQLIPLPMANFSVPPPQVSSVMPQPQVAALQTSNTDAMNLIRESDLASTIINWMPKESLDQNGSDLPHNDIPTLQFFFNLGVRYYNGSGVQRRLESVVNQLETMQVVDVEKVNDSNSLKSEPPPVPTNTPVTSKAVGLNYGPPGGHRFHNNSYGNSYRRPFSSSHNREGRDNRGETGKNQRGGFSQNNHGQRKEIQFNSNVKNLHKAESGFMKPNGNGHQNVAVSNSNINAVEKPQYSPISPLSNEAPAPVAEQQSQPLQQPMQTYQTFQSYPQQTYIPAAGVPVMYQVAADGSTESFIMPQSVPYGQQIYYQYPQATSAPPQTPIYYQPQIPQIMNGTMDNSNDSAISGVVDTHGSYQHPYTQPIYFQSYQPQALPFYYPTTPVPQTPQYANATAPTFHTSVPIQQNQQYIHAVPIQQNQGTSPTKTQHIEEPEQASDASVNAQETSGSNPNESV